MSLYALAGVDIPEIQLVELNKLDNLPQINLPNEKLAFAIKRFDRDGLADIQQFAKRLLVNILLANGDVHLKNWSLLYQAQITPRLSPAYDIVTTSVYIEDEQEYALNFDKNEKLVFS